RGWLNRFTVFPGDVHESHLARTARRLPRRRAGRGRDRPGRAGAARFGTLANAVAHAHPAARPGGPFRRHDLAPESSELPQAGTTGQLPLAGAGTRAPRIHRIPPADDWLCVLPGEPDRLAGAAEGARREEGTAAAALFRVECGDFGNVQSERVI